MQECDYKNMFSKKIARSSHMMLKKQEYLFIKCAKTQVATLNLLFGNAIPLSLPASASSYLTSIKKRRRKIDGRSCTPTLTHSVIVQDGTTQAFACRFRSVFHVGMLRCPRSPHRLPTSWLRPLTPW